MRRSFPLFLVLGLVAVCSVAAVQMGWNEYTFRKTQVAVMMPAGGEWLESVQDDRGGKTYNVTTTADGISFTAVSKKLKRNEAANYTDATYRTELYAAFEAGLRSNAEYEVTAVRDIELNGVPGRELDFIRTDNQYGFIRILYKDLRAITLMMMKEGEYPNNFHADVFFASVKFLD